MLIPILLFLRNKGLPLMPLSPSKVCRDQNIMRGKREVKRKCLEEGKKGKNKKKEESVLSIPIASNLLV